MNYAHKLGSKSVKLFLPERILKPKGPLLGFLSPNPQNVPDTVRRECSTNISW